MIFPRDNPHRWLEELRALQPYQKLRERVESGPPAYIEGKVETEVGVRHYRLVWPPDFPLRPPSIWELDPEGKPRDHRHHGNVFADLSLCLFAHSAEHGWQPEFTAATALAQFGKYLEAVERDQLPRLDQLAVQANDLRVSVPTRLAQALRGGGTWGELSGFLRHDGRLLLITGADGTTSTSTILVGRKDATPDPRWIRQLGLRQGWHGMWCRLASSARGLPPTRQELSEQLRRHLPNAQVAQFLESQRDVLLVHSEVLWLALLNLPGKAGAAQDRPRYVRAVEEDIPRRIFLRVEDRLNAADKLRSCRVAIIGTGSLGSSIALSLAKAGIGRFVLMDPEVLEPENVARHVGGLTELGLPKVEVVARAILRVNAEAEIVPVQAPLSLDPVSWQLDTGLPLREVLGDPDGIVICTTASAGSEQIVNQLSVTHGCPVVFAAVLGRAEHGRVFRVMPGRTPCYQCILLAQAADPMRFPRFEAEDLGRPAYAQPGIPGLGMDVEQIALLAARLALQTLSERIAGGIGYPPAHGDHVLWSAHGGWAVDGPLQVCFQRIERQPDCRTCGSTVHEGLDGQAQAELEALLTPPDQGAP